MKIKAFKITLVVLVIILIIGGGYFAYSKISQSKETVSTSTNEMTAEDIVNQLKEKNSNIGKVIVYTQETDTNNLLGRPNQYTSKVQFADSRISQEFVEENDAKGGTIEVFANKEDMEARKKYVEEISSKVSMFAQYIYSSKNALLRLEKDLTPEQAKEYENAFYEIMK